VNSLHPGATRGTRLNKNLRWPLRLVQSAVQWFMKSVPQGAATQALLAASPRVSGITGEYWENCRVAAGNPLVNDAELGKRLWDFSQEILLRHRASQSTALRQAA
jgi:WW domain-containing oxidoreductase